VVAVSLAMEFSISLAAYWSVKKMIRNALEFD
jgi:hypothetical protein